ncbi:MAG: hypothetical protein V4617_13005 [Gemmatimonadota bacterium]
MVLLSLLLVASLTAATQIAAWRATRAARLAWNAERATHAADEAIALTVADWHPEAVARRAIGERWSRTVLTAGGVLVEVSLARTAPLDLVVMARATSKVSGAPDTASRRIVRALSLHVPPFPLHAAFTTLGAVGVHGGAVVDGRDLASALDGCGTSRDTLSVTGVYGGAVTADALAAIAGAPPVFAPGLGSPTLLSDSVAFTAAWDTAQTRTSQLRRLAPGAPLGATVPWESVRLMSADSVGPATVMLGGVSRHEGLLLVDGDLVVVGTLLVHGLLVVRGTVDVTNGVLDVRGSVIVGGEGARASTLGALTRVQYSPCSTRRALAAISRPRVAPFGLWMAR